MALVALTAACATDADDEASTATPPLTESAPATEPATTEAPGATTAPGATEPDGPDPTPAPAPAPDTTPTATPVEVPEALQFTAPLVGGGEFDGASTAGTPTAFWFWAPT